MPRTSTRVRTPSSSTRASLAENESDSESTTPDARGDSETSSRASSSPPPSTISDQMSSLQIDDRRRFSLQIDERRRSSLQIGTDDRRRASSAIESSTFCRNSVTNDLQQEPDCLSLQRSSDYLVLNTGETIVGLPSHGGARSSFSSLFALLQTFSFWLDIILMQRNEDNKFITHITEIYELGKLLAEKNAPENTLDAIENSVKGIYDVLGADDDNIDEVFKKMLYKVIAMTKENDNFLYKSIRKEICVSVDGSQTDGPEDNVMCFVTASKVVRNIEDGLSIGLQKSYAHIVRMPSQLIIGVKNNGKVIQPETEMDPSLFTKNPEKTKGHGMYELYSMVFHNLDDTYTTITKSKSNEKWICISNGEQSVLTDEEWYSKLQKDQVIDQVIPDIVVYTYKQLKASVPQTQLDDWRPRSPNKTKRFRLVQAKAQEVFRYFDDKMQNIVGLQAVKDELKQLMIDMLGNVIVESTVGRQTNIKRPVMLFSGSPGTGKTHTATIVAKLLKICEVVDSSRLVVTTRPDLVAQHIGETAPKTQKKIDEARGGTMMVDEAYQLAPVDSPKDYGKEAVHTIMDTIEGEDYTSTDRPAYIFAGYPSKMQTLLNVNAGLLRRITHIFTFPNYTYPELAQICKIIAERQGLEIQVRTSTMVMCLRQLPTELCSRLNASLSQQVFLRCKSILYKRIVYTTMKDPAAVTKEFVSVISEDIFRQAVLEVKEKYNTV